MSFWIEGVAIPIVSSFGLAGESAVRQSGETSEVMKSLKRHEPFPYRL